MHAFSCPQESPISFSPKSNILPGLVFWGGATRLRQYNYLGLVTGWGEGEVAAEEGEHHEEIHD